MSALRGLALACTAAWIGIMAFFSFVAAPQLFRVLGRQEAGELVATLLPAYYHWGIALSGLAVGALVVVGARAAAGRLRHLLAASLGAIMVVSLAWALGITLPEANRARRVGEDTAFAAAHRRAVRLNVLVLLCGTAVVVLEALTPIPRRAR
jgi:hypothetical protein